MTKQTLRDHLGQAVIRSALSLGLGLVLALAVSSSAARAASCADDDKNGSIGIMRILFGEIDGDGTLVLYMSSAEIRHAQRLLWRTRSEGYSRFQLAGVESGLYLQASGPQWRLTGVLCKPYLPVVIESIDAY
jgi:hypothetical protein